MAEDKSYLEAGDAWLFATMRGKHLGLIWDSPSRNLEVGQIESYLKDVCPDLPNLGSENEVPELDLASPNTWVLLSCSADYSPTSAVRNHWIPCVTRAQAKDAFFDLTGPIEAKIRGKYRKLRERFTAYELDPENADGLDPDPETAAQQIESLKTACTE